MRNLRILCLCKRIHVFVFVFVFAFVVVIDLVVIDLVQDFFEVFNFEILTGFFGVSGFIFFHWVRSKSRRCNSVLIDIRFI